MEDLKEYFEGSLKDSITGELFHGSPKQIDVVLPNTASHGRPYVYASPDYLFALCYAGLQWNDFEINQSYYNGDLYLTEIQKGKFREKLQRPGYVYHLNKDDFKKLPNSGENEYISDQAVVPLSVDEIPNVYRRLDREGVHLIEYPNLPPFIEDRKDYIIEQAKKLYVQDNQDMLEYLCSTFPGKVANSLKEYVSSYTGESTEDSSKDTYTDNDYKTILKETSDSDSADIPSENEENSEVSIEKEIPKVYFTREITPESLIRLYYKIAEGKTLPGKMMVKLSSGEPGGHNFLQPSLIGPLVNIVHGTICDANTAYEGPRKHTDTHYQTMKDHGFTDIAPVDVLDGEGEIEIPVNDGYYLKTLPVGSHNSNYGSFLILTHFKGHSMAGFGGAIKNIAIGMASSRGKAIVHSGGQSETEIMGFDQQVFLKSMVDSIKASIDYGGRENFLYINVANRLSVDCDCDAHPAEPTMKDIGVFASNDPLAIDQACIDAVDRASDNKDLIARIKRQTGRNILKYAEDAGIGSRKYELIDLDAEPVSEDTFDQVLGSMFKEYSYPPHREEPMDTIPEQTVPSKHSFLRDEEDEKKPAPGFANSIKKETVSDLDALFNDALTSFTESESKSESPLEQINLDNLRDLGSMFTELTTTSKLDENHKQKEKKNLSQFKKVVCTEDDIAKWKKKFPAFRHVRESDNCHFAFWMDNDEDLVAYVNIEPRDEDHVIQALEVSEKYKGSGLGSQLLKYAEDQGANKLFVNPENEVAVAMYKKGGWEYGPKSDGKLQPMIKEAAGVMEFLPYVGVKKDPPPDTDYPGSPFKALEESYETIFEFRNEMANECVKVMETPFSPNSVFIEAGDYHYPDIIHELVEDVITDIQNGSEDYAEKSNLVWHITGENAEPLCAIADDLGFVQIPNIDPKNMDMVTYAMDIQEFTPEKTQYATEAVDVTSIFRADDDYVYLNVPYCEFYIPTEYFTIGKKFAEDFTDKIHTIGLFNIGIFENDKLVDVKVFNVPVYLDIMVYDYDVRMIDVGSGTPVECRVYKYYQDSIICRSFIAENSGVAQTFLQLIISGSMPGTIPYNQILSVWRKNLELSSVHLGVSSAIMEMILAVVYRDSKDPSKKYCIRYGSSADSSEFDYMSASIRQICQYNSTFTGIIYEDIDSMITSAINRNRNGKEEGETPIERIIKM